MKICNTIISLFIFFSFQAQTESFALENVAQDKVNKKKWRCEYCLKPALWSGNWALTAAYVTDDEPVFNNIIDHENGLNPDGALDLRYQAAEKYARLRFSGVDGDILNPGMSAGIDFGYFSGVDLRLRYQESPRFYAGNGQTPFIQGREAQLTLPDDWQPSSNSQHMPGLNQALEPINLELMREQLSLAFQYRSKSPWQPRLQFSQEEKEGVTLSTGFNNSHMTSLPNPIDYTTTRLNTGLAYLAPNWMTDVSYIYVDFDNEHKQLNWQDPFTLNQQVYGLAPDNEFHPVAVKVRYRANTPPYLAHGTYSQSLQDENFINNDLTTAVNSLDGRIDETNLQVKIVHRYDRKMRLSAKFSFDERHNNTEQYLIGERYNRVYNVRNNKMEFLAQVKNFDAFNLKLIASFINKERPGQQRTHLDENKIQLSITEKVFTSFDLSADYLVSRRNGSAFKQDLQAKNLQNQRLKRSNLADRDRNEINARISSGALPLFNIDLNVFYAKDDYAETDVGLTQGKDRGYELSFSGSEKQIHWQFYYARQKLSYEQAGSDNLGTANWWSSQNSDTEQFGLNLEIPDLIEEVLALALDYNYSTGEIEASVEQGRVSDFSTYPDNDYKHHRFDLHLDYILSDKAQLSSHFIYERNKDEDYFDHNLDVDTLTNLVSAGTIGNDYNNTYLGLTYKRSF